MSQGISKKKKDLLNKPMLQIKTSLGYIAPHCFGKFLEQKT